MNYVMSYCFLAIMVLLTNTAYAETGVASFYGDRHHGRLTASGERFNQYAMTCAHKTRLLGSIVRISFKDRSILCRVNDRGPYVRGRIVDLSKGAARALGIEKRGVAKVVVSEP